MKKEFAISKLAGVPRSDNTQVVAFRSGNTLHTQNIQMPAGAEIVFDAATGVVTFSFKLADGDYLTLRDEQGFVAKKAL